VVYHDPHCQRIVISGTSTSYGPYDHLVVTKCLRDRYNYKSIVVGTSLQKGRLLIDPDWNLIKVYPSSRISVKHFGEAYPPVKHRVVDQHFYDGVETRLFINVPQLLPGMYYGDNCDVCRKISSLARNIKSFNGYSTLYAIEDMVGAVTGVSHVKNPGIDFKLLCNLIIGGSRRQLRYDVMKVEIQSVKHHRVTDEMFDRALRYLAEHQIVGLCKKTPASSVSGYPVRGFVPNGDHQVDQPVFWNVSQTEFVQQSSFGLLLYSRNGKLKSQSAQYLEFMPRVKRKFTVPNITLLGMNEVEILIMTYITPKLISVLEVKCQLPVRLQRLNTFVTPGFGCSLAVVDGNYTGSKNFLLVLKSSPSTNFHNSKNYDLKQSIGLCQLWRHQEYTDMDYKQQCITGRTIANQIRVDPTELWFWDELDSVGKDNCMDQQVREDSY